MFVCCNNFSYYLYIIVCGAADAPKLGVIIIPFLVSIKSLINGAWNAKFCGLILSDDIPFARLRISFLDKTVFQTPTSAILPLVGIVGASVVETI